MLASARARVGVGVLVLLVLASIGAYAFISAQKPAGAAAAGATLTIYKGTAQRAPAGSNTFAPVLSGQALHGGDQVRTGAATAAAIRFGDGSITRLDSNTTITIRELTHQGSEYQTGFFQSAGKTWNKVQRLVGVARYNVTGPNSSTAEVRGTTFVLIIEPNGDVRIDDYQGTVIFHAKAGSVTVTTGQSSTLLNGSSNPQPTTGIPTADLQDPFTVFNIAADANLDATGNGDILSVNANNTIAVAETQGAFVGGGADGNSDLSFTLDWPGSTFELVIIDPDGVEYDSVVSDQHPVTYTVPKPRAGDWSYRVHDISSAKPKENWSVVVGAIRPAKQTPNLFFRGGAKQVCDHTVIGGQADTWSIRARDAAGAPTLTTRELPAYGSFTDDHRGTGTFKFTPPAAVAPADLAITITSSFGGGSATLGCMEHVIPPKDASVGGQVVSGTSAVSGVLVTLTMPDSSTQIAYSDAGGNFGFSGLGAGDFTLAMSVPDGYKAAGPTSQTVTLDGKTAGTPVTFNLTAFAISLASFPNGSVGDPSCSVLSLLNGVAPVTWSVSSGAMPTGTGVDVYGHCNGTPTAAGTFTFTLSATDANGDTASRAYTITVFPAPSINGPGPAVTPISLQPWDRGFANPQTLTGAGGIPPYSWSVVSGAFPKGLSIGAATGTIDGVTSAPVGRYGASIQLTDAAGAQGYRTVYLTVDNPPRFRSTLADDANRGQPFERQLSISGAPGPITVTASGLPSGLSASVIYISCTDCSNSGLQVELTGTPTAAGNFTPTLVIHDPNGGSASLTGSIFVVYPSISIVQTALPNATLGQAYNATIAAAGGLLGPYTVSGGGSLPAGLTFTGTPTGGTITGLPTECGSFTPNFTAYDNSGSVFATLPLLVGAPSPTICSPLAGALPSSDVGVLSYSIPLLATGGTGPYTWSVATGLMPPDLIFSGNNSNAAALVLDPSANGFQPKDVNGNGAWNFSLVAVDSSAAKVQSAPVLHTITIYVAPVLTTPAGSLSAATPSPAFYQAAFTVTGGDTAGWTSLQLAPGSTVPSDDFGTIGLFIAQSNQCLPAGPCLEGNPTAVGTFTFSLIPIDSSGGVGATKGPYTLVINTPPPMTIQNASPLPPGMVGGGYSYDIIVSGGLFPYVFTASALPPGLALDPSLGHLSGSPTTAGTYNPTIQVSDGGVNPSVLMPFNIVVDPNLSITTVSLPGGDAGQAYSQPIAATGGSGSNAFALTNSSNLQIDPQTGVISTIKPPAVGLEIFQVFVNDSDGNQALMDYTIYFGDATAIVTASLPNATLKSGYCQALSARGGTPGYTWSLSSGSLPTGVALDLYGHLTGTPTVAGTYNFTVTATDTIGQTATRSYTVTIS